MLLTKIDKYWFVFGVGGYARCEEFLSLLQFHNKKRWYCASFTWEVLIRDKYRSYYLVFRIAVTKAAPHSVKVGIFSYPSSLAGDI